MFQPRTNVDAVTTILHTCSVYSALFLFYFFLLEGTRKSFSSPFSFFVFSGTSCNLLCTEEEAAQWRYGSERWWVTMASLLPPTRKNKPVQITTFHVSCGEWQRKSQPKLAKYVVSYLCEVWCHIHKVLGLCSSSKVAIFFPEELISVVWKSFTILKELQDSPGSWQP